MNERIRQLAKEASGGSHYLHTHGEPIQKFAELIIRECASWLEKTAVEFELAGDMLQHFGVEE